MSPSTHAPPKETHLLIQVIFSLTACFIAIYFFVHLFRAPSSISPSPASSAPPPFSPAYPSHHQHNGPTSQLSSPSPGDLAAYNFFCHSSSSLVKSIRSGLAPASAEVSHQNSVALWGTDLPVPPLVVLVSVRLTQLERSYPYLLHRPALERVWAVAGIKATKEDMEAALSGKLEVDPKRDATIEEDAGKEFDVKEAMQVMDAKLNRLSDALKLDRPDGP